MKSFNRRSFVHLCAAAAAAVVLLPRKAVGALSARPAADTSAAAALIKKAPGSVCHAPRPRKAYAAPAAACSVCDVPHGRKGGESL